MIKKKNDLLLRDDVQEYLSRKAVPLLKKFVSRFDMIKPRKYAKHSVTLQKRMRKVILRARELAMIPYTK